MIGMMWLDTDPSRPLEMKIQRAVDFYRAKYGANPNWVRVNPGALTDEKQIAGMTVKPMRGILPGHLWIGVAEAARGLERHSIHALAGAEALAQKVKRITEAES